MLTALRDSLNCDATRRRCSELNRMQWGVRNYPTQGCLLRPAVCVGLCMCLLGN